VLHRVRAIAASILAGAAAILLAGDQATIAADHLDSPTRTDPAFSSRPDRAADIADLFIWYTATDIVIALTFAGPEVPGTPPSYDRDLLYQINLSNDGDATTTEFPIEIRFGQDMSGGTIRDGVQVKGLPGGTVIEGPVETRLEKNGILFQAGLFDDPFYFDLQGFRDTKATGVLSFDNRRSFFTGKNDTAFVLQVPRSQVQDGNKLINVWSAVSRFGGRL
jgi:hypothetical protein